MIKPSGYYESMTDDALAAESKSRGIAADTREDLIAHLQLDDEATASDPREQDPKGLSQKQVATSDGVMTRSVPSDLDEYKGQYKLLKDGFPDEVFGLKVIEGDVRHGKTHHAKSPLHFGDYTPDEFRAQFEKV